jgi:hypothetical protein
VTRKEREELCALSEESFGSRYAWLSYLRTPKLVPGKIEKSDGTLRDGKVTQWRTLDEIVKEMKGETNANPILLPLWTRLLRK